MAQITQLATVTIPVGDQDRALAFYVERLGLERRADFTYADGARWVEVAPRGAATQLTLVRGQAGVETGVVLASADLEGDHAELRAGGVDVGEILGAGDPIVRWAGVVLAGIPSMFLLRDADGNSLLVVQAGAP